MMINIATEEFSHLEIIGAIIQMLLGPVNGELKNVYGQSKIMQLLMGKGAKESMIHEAMINLQFLTVNGEAHSYGC